MYISKRLNIHGVCNKLTERSNASIATHTHAHTHNGLFVLSGNVAGELP